MNWMYLNVVEQWRIGGGGGGGRGATGAPPKVWSTVVFFSIPFCIRMLQNRAQIAWESTQKKKTSRALGGPWTPAEWDSGFAIVMCVRAHNLLPPPPPMKILDQPLLSVIYFISNLTFSYVVTHSIYNLPVLPIYINHINYVALFHRA